MNAWSVFTATIDINGHFRRPLAFLSYALRRRARPWPVLLAADQEAVPPV
jgi:hypothetical protein